MFISIVIPTYNRLPILEKCLSALESQTDSEYFDDFEIIVVDDGSDDGTVPWLESNSDFFPHLRLITQEHGGPGIARNKGVAHSKGNVIVFIDSDLVVTNSFLENHSFALQNAWINNGNRLCFTYGAVINTANFENPTSEPHKLSDLSWAYFATGNVAIDKNTLVKSGLFDPSFRLYGWEDLELGERLRKMGTKLIRCPKAVGYHWHAPFNLNQVNSLIRVERERAKMAIIFYRKHPTTRVRFIIQYTLFHRLLWETLTLCGILNELTLRPLLKFLIQKGFPGLAMELFRIPLNLICVRQIYREAKIKGFS